MLREAQERDVDLIRRWRNHPEVRRQFIHTAEITPEQHRTWWSEVSTDPASTVLMYDVDGAPAGVVIFKDHDPSTGRAEWGFFLDVDGLKRDGALLSAWVGLERAAIRYAFDTLGVTVLGGRTRASNAAVLELHRRCGFVEVPRRRYTVEVDGARCDVVWTELRSDRADRGPG